MLFNSIGFVFYALPIFLTGYFLLGHYSTRSAALIWLVIVSLIFYASWDPGALFLLVGSTLLNFAIGRLMLRRPRPDSRRLLLLLTGLAANIGVLCYFKYANFIVDNLNALGDTDFAVPTIILPLAISFFTFQKIAYLVDGNCSPPPPEYKVLKAKSFCLHVGPTTIRRGEENSCCQMSCDNMNTRTIIIFISLYFSPEGRYDAMLALPRFLKTTDSQWRSTA